MNVLIVDPAVHSIGGHHYNAVARLQRELSKFGINAPCLGSVSARRETLDGLQCTPCFTTSVYGTDYASPGDTSRIAEQTSRQLTQALCRQKPRPDLLILPCCDQILAAAVARALRRPGLSPMPHIVMWLLYGPNQSQMKGIRAAGSPEDCRKAFSAVQTVVGGHRLTALCETTAMADLYRSLLPFEIGVIPGPGLVATPRPERQADANQEPMIACIGFANRSKGYGLLPEAVRTVLQRHRSARFMIHGIIDGSDAEDERSVFDRLSKMGERVVTNQDVLTPDAYLAWLGQADLVLLPYDPQVYRSRGSGVFADARNIGIPIVATEGCAFAQPAFDGGWGVGICSYTPSGLGEAILEALDRRPDLAARAASAAEDAKDELGPFLHTKIEAVRRERPPGLAARLRRLLPAGF